MCNTFKFIAYILMVIHMNKKQTILLIILNIIVFIVINYLIQNKELLNKISIFLTASFSLLLTYLFGLIRGKNGLILGLIIGISIASISTIIHYLYAKDYFDHLYIRMGVIILSGASGGVFGVNKKYPI